MADGDSGVGVGTPIVPGIGSGIAELVPQVYTLLPLADYARVMGINPIQFMSGVAANYFPTSGGTDRWVQYAWQDDAKVSREELAYEIQRAERDITAVLRYWPGPMWVEDEEILYPQFHRKGYVGQYGHDSNRQMKSVKFAYGKFITGGKRVVSLIGTVTKATSSLQYEDNDSDGFAETARITVATSLTNACELKVYFQGKNGEKEWEIRPLKTKSITGGVFEATVDSWLLLDPKLLAALPGTYPTGFQAIDAEDLDNYVSDLDVYREYTDPAEQCYMMWPGSDVCACGGTGCAICGYETQTACLTPKEGAAGLISVAPATYDAGSAVWTYADFTHGYEPSRVRVSYLSGLQEENFTTNCFELPRDIALAISYMTTARLSRPLCTHSETLRKREKELKEDLIFISPGGDATRFVTREVLNCPFGTRYGELEAWRIVRDRLAPPSERNVDVAIV